MSYARKYEEFERRGAQVVGISVDPPDHSAGLVEKLSLPFPLLSDPQGALIKRYGLWNEKDRVSVPAIVVVDRTGRIVWLYAGHDFSDRPGDDNLFSALDETGAEGETPVGKEQVHVSAERAGDSVRADKAVLSIDQLSTYYRGAYFATVALKERLARLGASSRDALREVGNYQRMVQEYMGALQSTREMSGEG